MLGFRVSSTASLNYRVRPCLMKEGREGRRDGGRKGWREEERLSGTHLFIPVLVRLRQEDHERSKSAWAIQ